MHGLKNRIHRIKPFHLRPAGILLLIFLAAFLLWSDWIHSMQATSPIAAKVRFYGEYRIGDGQWREITEGQHIPATKGDVTLRGNFHILAPDGEYIGIYRGDTPIAIYTDHINLTIVEGDNEPFVMDVENPLFGSSACCVYWSAYLLSSGSEETIEILIHNPHRFGNENAIDEMLSNVAFWLGIDFEREMMAQGQSQRNTGLFFVIVAFVLLGSALFSALLHLPNNRIIWLLGAAILSAGIYLIYSAPGISFWSEFRAGNTSVLGFSMMFYMLFVSEIITYLLKGTKRIGHIATVSLGVMNGICFLLPVLTKLSFYDTWLPWAITQSVVNGVLLFCLITECLSASHKMRWTYAGMGLLLFAFEIDVIATFYGYWEGGVICQYVFYILFLVTLFLVLYMIPQNIHIAEKAKALELQRIRLEAEKML